MATPAILMAILTVALVIGCGGGAAVRPAEVLDERTGATLGALQEPIELVENSADAALTDAKRSSFAYLGPVEWDRSGELSYSLWIHVAPGNDRQTGDIRSRDGATLILDDGPLPLTAVDEPKAGAEPYRAVASWGQTAYFELDAAMLKRMAASRKLGLKFRAVDQSTVEFTPSHDTRAILTQFLHSRGITAD